MYMQLLKIEGKLFYLEMMIKRESDLSFHIILFFLPFPLRDAIGSL